jgi:hypothetical protein
MKRYWPLFVLALVLTAIVGMSQYAESTKQHYEESTRQANAAPVAKSDDGNAHDNTNHPYQPPVWAKYVTWPEGVGAWAVILTMFIIAWQSIETRAAAIATEDAANASRDSIRIQEAGVRQWVNVVPIGLEIRNKLEDTSIVVLKFEALNRTDFPLTILGTDIEVIANIHTPQTFVTECRHSLVPQKADGDSTYPFFMEIVTTMNDWSNQGRIFIVAGDIKFLDCMGIERTQTIEDLYRGFKSGGLERMKPAGITGPPQAERDD